MITNLLEDLLDEDDHDHEEEYDRHSVPGRTQGATLTEQSWYSWHAPYDDLESEQTDRLAAVQDQLVAYLDGTAPGPLRALSVCAGQSRDLLPILISHPRGADVRASMLELDPLNASFLHGALGSTRLTTVDVVVTDAGTTDAYAGRAPADLVLLCGVLANIDVPDTRTLVDALPMLCAPGATVVWSSYGESLADVDEVLRVFAAGPFEEVAVRRGGPWVVGVHRFAGVPVPLEPGRRLFGFRDS
ncbi:hypothetical protein KIH74_06185 [Kineosporia sp. J2-2]|uniref:Uncharacterized protein n=1 Tax=Kineosporia corallincola TaxID=2835133 RepID=A0ABS5TBR8_9ACTN|nr:hypothetical protein [Kineosporia corallincola]MBT0768505.1 hypothetical protein [Kineosporia corallincola]